MADDGWPHMGKQAAQIGLSKLFKIRTQSWEEVMGSQEECEVNMNKKHCTRARFSKTQ